MRALIARILPRWAKRMASQLLTMRHYRRGADYAQSYRVAQQAPASGVQEPEPNPLWEYFQQHNEGPGIWKWEHYFEVYHRHLKRFVGRPVDLLEIGIYSGGSLGMWRSYFGDQCHVYGVDIEEACRTYESDQVSVFIGDQEDPEFWAGFKQQVPGIDILIDDGGHKPGQQMVTLEQMLPHLRPGGVYICEDVQGAEQRFAGFVSGLISELNHAGRPLDGGLAPSSFQADCHSIHWYPYLVVIEKHLQPPQRFAAPKHGTSWQPFFD